jgi:hypothetical protein
MDSVESIPESPGDTWRGIESALSNGRRGLHGGSSLARLLDDYGKKPNRSAQPPLSYKKILAWADAHFARTGTWPNSNSGSVVDAPGGRWDLIGNALQRGLRGLAGNSSLLRLLARKGGVRNPLDLPPLSLEQVLSWADAHFRRTGKRPTCNHGPIMDAPGETWAGVEGALRYGRRGLPGGSSLAKLLNEHGR